MSVYVIIGIGFVLSALFSGAETGGYTLNRIRLRRRAREQERSACRLERMLQKPHRYVFTILICNNMAIYLISEQVTGLFLDTTIDWGALQRSGLPWSPEIAATLTLMIPLFLFAETLPKNLFRIEAERWMHLLSMPLSLLTYLFLPFTWPLERLQRWMMGAAFSSAPLGWNTFSPEALKEVLKTRKPQGTLAIHQSNMMDKVLSMHRIPVRMLMISVTQTPCLSSRATVRDLKRFLQRKPVDKIILVDQTRAVGVLHVADVAERQPADEVVLHTLARDVLQISAIRSVKSAFYRLRRHPSQWAVITDARGQMQGSISLEDIFCYMARV